MTEPRTRKKRQDEPGAKLKVHMVSLGCPKNLVDSEMVLGDAAADDLAITTDPEDADVLLVNTCGFIDKAKEESINTILEMCEIKRASGTPKKVVVLGCLAQRYGADLRKEVPEVDAILGLGEYEDIGSTLRSLFSGEHFFRVSDPDKACNAEVGRFRLTPAHYAYVKISEGCDNPCTFCAIPAIRGRFRSKPLPMILEEVREFASNGAREICLISQDTTSYGFDSSGRFELPRLLEAVAAVQGVEWIRLLYAYPSSLSDEIIDAVAGIGKVIKYLDLPLQHISDTMLRHMGRRSNEAKTRALLTMLRERIPGLYLRTTFIVGFPGEGEEEFQALRDFVREFKFERLGVFTYSDEEGTPAARFAGQVPEDVRERRSREIMLAQQENAFQHNRSRKGSLANVLVDAIDGPDRAGKMVLRARSYGEAPEIDPVIFVRASKGRASRPAISPGGGAPGGGFRELSAGAGKGLEGSQPGDFLAVRIAGSKGYDLIAHPAQGASADTDPGGKSSFARIF